MPRGRIIRLTHSSRVLKGNPLGDPSEREIPIYLPADYEESTEEFAILWVLAPFTSWGERYFNLKAWDENIVQRMDRLVEEGKAKPVIMVFPDCFTKYGGSQYLNSSAVGNYEDYVVEELIPFVEDQLRCTPQKRGIMGYSSGGFGALHLAAARRGMFIVVGCHSGDMGFDYCYRADFPAAVRGLEQYGGIGGFIDTIGTIHNPSRDWFPTLNTVAMSACYSPNPEAEYGFDLPFDMYTAELRGDVWERWLGHDPVRFAAEQLEALSNLKALYFDCGSFDEANLFLGARMFHRLLESNDVKHTYEECDGGHRNINWRYEVSLPILTKSLAG